MLEYEVICDVEDCYFKMNGYCYCYKIIVNKQGRVLCFMMNKKD